MLHYKRHIVKKLLFILTFICHLQLLNAQEMSVKSFYLAETDLTANTPGTMVHDQNGNVCALIKVETTHKGFTFDVGVLGVVSVVENPAEIWVYVPFGIRKITIQHPQLGIIRDYQIPCSIESGRTYILKLTSGTIRTIVENAVTKQFLHIDLNPKEAIIELNGKIKATNNGTYQELLPFGKYQYRCYSENYHEEVGIIEINDPNRTHNLDIKLKPAFGFVSILESCQPDIKGAAVYVDEKYAGLLPIKDYQVSSGKHQIKIIKEQYEAYTDAFVITDEETKVLTPELITNFAEVTLRTSDEAFIYVNGEIKGLSKWSGRLAYGSYVFESTKPGHITYQMLYDITQDNQVDIINIPGPTPIYGSFIISSEPSKAKISIDGEYIGVTPKYIANHVIGDYEVSVDLDGYESQSKSVRITEGDEVKVNFALIPSESKPIQDTYNTALTKPTEEVVSTSTPKVKKTPSVSLGIYGYLEGFYSFSTGTGIQARIGKTTARLNFVTGLRYQYTKNNSHVSYDMGGYIGDTYISHLNSGYADYIQKNHQLILPAILHINYYNEYGGLCGFWGLGYEHGFHVKRVAQYENSIGFNEIDYLNSSDYPNHTVLAYPARNAVLRMGMGAQHWEWSITMKLFLNMAGKSEGGSMGVDFTYYF